MAELVDACDEADLSRGKVAWLIAEGAGITGATGYMAAASPDGLSRLQWLADTHGYQPDWGCLWNAWREKRASAETVRWLLDQAEVEMVVLCQTAPAGDAEKVLALHDAGHLTQPGSPTGLMLLDALRSGYKEASLALLAIRFTLEGREIMSATLAAAAACSGRVVLMAVLSQLGCPFKSSAWDKDGGRMWPREGAAVSGCEAALEFLAEMGCAKPTDGGPYVAAASNGDLRTLGVLRRLGMPFGPRHGRAFARAVGAFAAPLPALRWLVEAGFPVRWGAAAAAVEERHGADAEEVRAWVEAQRQAAGAEEEEEGDEEEEEEEEEEGWEEPGEEDGEGEVDDAA
ncbi:hypothetical protein HYH03_001136 [Edaphochlamys debaryana]|uniref:Uncharacterized protein n=1 Tax=Edaphochlamys debaryana TaxID=47281 RepID=A0A835YF21_9CHLO|nr:hypothetical protein HYH03_001136 [Edaphochlamys debaryana]|eukprot:KAG2501346.1 hypothetical protein HYH03_001136 [Edaphochlamys debaryana]